MPNTAHDVAKATLILTNTIMVSLRTLVLQGIEGSEQQP